MSAPDLPALPSSIMSATQLLLARRQLDSLIAAARRQQTDMASLVTKQTEPLSDLLAGNAALNGCLTLKDQLATITHSAPVVRLTLSALPSQAFRARLTRMFRELHPHCLVEILTDQSIIGGAVIRTPRHVYDVSLRQRLAETPPKGILTNA